MDSLLPFQRLHARTIWMTNLQGQFQCCLCLAGYSGCQCLGLADRNREGVCERCNVSAIHRQMPPFVCMLCTALSSFDGDKTRVIPPVMASCEETNSGASHGI